MVRIVSHLNQVLPVWLFLVFIVVSKATENKEQIFSLLLPSCHYLKVTIHVVELHIPFSIHSSVHTVILCRGCPLVFLLLKYSSMIPHS